MTDSRVTPQAAAVEAAAEAMHNIEYPAWSETAVEDSNRWSWRGDGHLGPRGETDHYDWYREQAATALTAAVPLLCQPLQDEIDRLRAIIEAVERRASRLRAFVSGWSISARALGNWEWERRFLDLMHRDDGDVEALRALSLRDALAASPVGTSNSAELAQQ